MKNLLIIIASATLLFGGCRGSKFPEPMFYLIEYPTNNATLTDDSTQTLPITIEIEAVNVNPAFSSYQIAIREKTHRIRYFSFYFFASRPEQSLNRFLLSFYEQNKYFQNIDNRFWKVTPDYNLTVTIHHLEVVKDAKSYIAHLVVEFLLKNTKTEEIALIYKEAKTQPLSKRDLNLFAQAISKMFFDEVRVFSEKAQQFLKTE